MLGAARRVLRHQFAMTRMFTQPRVAPLFAHASLLVERQLVPGTEVGSYRIERTLGEGGMAIVYEATHRVLPRRVAIKVMRVVIAGEAARTRLLREACVLAELSHPAIVGVVDAGVLDDGRAWLAMNIVDGMTLSERLLVHGTLTPFEVVDLLSHVASALATAHTAGVVHRDLKPENILVVDHACPVRVIDWGIAQDTNCHDERLTIDGSITGTPHYMAPEQARGEVVDGRCDVYALGIVAYEALSGNPPFVGGSVLEIVAHHLTTAPRPIQEVAPGTPTWLGALVMNMLSKDPGERPDMSDVALALARLRRAVAVTVPPPVDEPDYELHIEIEVEDVEDEEDGVVIEMVADMADDECDLELDTVIADLPLPPSSRRRFAHGSQPHALEGIVIGEFWAR